MQMCSFERPLNFTKLSCNFARIQQLPKGKKSKMCTIWNKLPRDLRECSSISVFRKASKLITLNWLSMCDFFASCLFVCLLSELLSALCFCFLVYCSEILWTNSLLDVKVAYKYCDIIIINTWKNDSTNCIFFHLVQPNTRWTNLIPT